MADEQPAHSAVDRRAGVAHGSGVDEGVAGGEDDRCATLAAALNSGALPALEKLALQDIPASAAAKAAVYKARANLEH